MALTGLDIYKLLPKTNCKECGFATCLAFAMALAQKKTSLDKCPHVSAAARDALESASQPPIKLVTIGTGTNKIEIGNETVMYRHEQKFYHPTAIGFLLEDTLPQPELEKRVDAMNALQFERVGQIIKPDLICIKNSSGSKDKFMKALQVVFSKSRLNIALLASDSQMLKDALTLLKSKRPLLICEGAGCLDGSIQLAKDNNVPLAITCRTLEEAADSTDKARKAGVEEIVINLAEGKLTSRVQNFTYARRAALKKNFRPLGFPLMAFTGALSKELELAEALSYVAKYAGIVIVSDHSPEFVFPLLVARQDIYADPQKPVQVEPKVYEIGKVDKNSPVLITTNFSITYFTVAGEVESSKVPAYIICCDAEGMSVLTAWAAEKFTAEKIVETFKKVGIENIVSHKKITIPGYVAVMSSKLEDALSGWEISVGPREASGLTNYLRNWKS